MLPDEIAPFADLHIENLSKVLRALNMVQYKPGTIQEIELAECYNMVHDARHALVRFKVCMTDEVEQKKRYRKYAKDHGYQYS